MSRSTTGDVTFIPDKLEGIPSLNGKIAVVTGGNGGIGYATIQHLARHGATVYMAARNEAKAQAAIKRLHEEGLAPGNGQVKSLRLDLSNPALARTAAEELLSEEDRLDVLSMMAHFISSMKSSALIHIGPFVFTMTLLPLLTKTAAELKGDVRIVNVSSGGIAFLRSGIRFNDRDDFNDEHKWDIIPGPSLARYCRSKLANVLFTAELQRRLDGAGIPILAMSVDPGLNDAASHASGISYIMSLLVRTLWTPPARGAFTSVFAAAAPDVRADAERYRGAFLQPPGRIGTPPHPDARNPALARELWDTTERLLTGMGIDVASINTGSRERS
ncbi:NAD(P)-binding protein [Daedalea quercina L-15889]|uniref:NAD(P)-binding protein n=1 Tax=Daedalea quercina L-15889 TaxID=1314783 RepID=A0A165Q1P0_9APHY|nr:NAD(P)-binding protein [Daedalea quercina L-15889]